MPTKVYLKNKGGAISQCLLLPCNKQICRRLATFSFDMIPGTAQAHAPLRTF